MPDVIPPAVQDGLDRIAEKIERYLTIREAMNYIRCRRSGGSMEECLGIYRLAPPTPGDPFFDELLNHVDIAEKHRLLSAEKDLLQEEVRRIDSMLSNLDLKN